MNDIYIGSVQKFAISITGEGFDMDKDEWTVEFRRGSKAIIIPKEEMLHEDAWIAVVDTDYLGAGNVKLIVRADVPDLDCGGHRKDVFVIENFFTIEKV